MGKIELLGLADPNDSSKRYPIEMDHSDRDFVVHPWDASTSIPPQVQRLIEVAQTQIVLPNWRFIAMTGNEISFKIFFAAGQGSSTEVPKEPFVKESSRPEKPWLAGLNMWQIKHELFDDALEPSNMAAYNAWVQYAEVAREVTRGIIRRTKAKQTLYAFGVGTINANMWDYAYLIDSEQRTIDDEKEEFREKIRPYVEKIRLLRSKTVPNPTPLFPVPSISQG